MRLTSLLKGLLLLLALCAFANAAPCDELKALIDKTYNFRPWKLTVEQRSAKSDEMDVIWKTVGNNPASYLPCLRSEIAQRKTDLFFRFDASNLVFKHDPSAETKKLMIETYSGADLSDVSHRYWLMYMAKFGFEGFDVSRAGETWLRYRQPPSLHLPRPVSKRHGALGLFGSMDEAIATPALAKLAAEGNTDFQDIVISLLIGQATSRSRDAVRKLRSTLPPAVAAQMAKEIAEAKLIVLREGTPKMSRAGYITAITELLEGKPKNWNRHTVEVPDGERDMVAVLTTEDLPLVRKLRRYYMSIGTNEAREWYELFAQVINTIETKSKTKPPVRRKGASS